MVKPNTGAAKEEDLPILSDKFALDDLVVVKALEVRASSSPSLATDGPEVALNWLFPYPM
jgi:hypothetical protein